MDAQPLWDDQRIDDVEPRYTETGKAYLMKLIRDDERKPLLARIASLEAALSAAREWQPLEDGHYERPNWDGNGTVTLAVGYGGSELEEWHSSNVKDVEEIGLPDDMRLCRRRTEGSESA